ncbi:hypothetical protein COU89_03320 [Candidatus Roizmanbacteria bacterium CG10_big_fil_rev_8_21_14_0_10_45_7]|uniref:Uncharacterized protein n=1 Tax=Candidatus Roizmanbacteria bacterium CG10_big_fil_rev_8_21_14_0_10_45_7 TaxID=1974854 RepID=A0A2M8KU79_9BACT|nr:MAG: hypothetical protein COU89_03320 [Candidatus Roizmanbacteria bacterium CG10_big_fil_rev_8_21_14_0_10_45_7]
MVRARAYIILALLLLFGIWFRVSEFTDADISDQVRIPGNRISMISISLLSKKTVNGLKTASLLHTDDLRPDGFDVGAVRIMQDSSATPLTYRLTAVQQGEDNGLCSTLSLDIYKANESIYRGKLEDVAVASTLARDGYDDWIFVVSLPSHDTDLKNRICDIDFVFSTKKINQQGGLYGESRVSNIISTGTW